MKTYLSAVLATALLVTLQGYASATTIVDDTFTDSDGQTLGPTASTITEHNPDYSATGNTWVYDTQHNSTSITLENNEAVIPATGADAEINISSSATNPGYVEPTTLTISGDLETADLITDVSFNALGLGYFSALPDAQVFDNFTGLALSSTGSVILEKNGAFPTFSSPDSQAFGISGETYNPDTVYNLTYTINTQTGYITSGTLTDTATGKFETLSFDSASDDVFSTASVAYAGIYARTENGHSGDAYVDNFSVTTTPEPSTYALLAAGLAALFFVCRRQRADSAN